MAMCNINDILAKKKKFLAVFIIIVALFLRFYRLEEFAIFLGDQGRDAIIIKRIITFEHLPAVGPPSSLGQIYLGPFFYYLMSPFLLFFDFNPVGLVFGVGLITLMGLIIAYKIVKNELNKTTSLFFLMIVSFSYVNIQQSRFSWNPNLLPVFSFFTLYFFYKTINEKKIIWPVLFGSFFSFSVQLHYLALLLIIPILLIIIIDLYRQNKKLFTHQSGKFLISFFCFIFFSLPLLIFDLRHNFLNSRNFFRLIFAENPVSQGGMSRFLQTNKVFYDNLFQFNFNQYSALLLTLLLIVYFFRKFTWEEQFVKIHFLNFFSFLFAFSLFNISRNFHYYGSIYFSFYLVMAYVLTKIARPKFIDYLLLEIIIIIYVFGNLRSLSYLFGPAGSQIEKAKRIAQSIFNNHPQIPFQTVALPQAQTEGHIRYFLEIAGKRPLPEDSMSQPSELYVLCFEDKCPSILGNPQWQIASFKNKKIDKMWKVENVMIYKLIHNK